MARTLRRVGGFVLSTFFLVGLTVLSAGSARSGESREPSRDKADRDAEFARFVESNMTPEATGDRVKIKTVAATCDPGKARARRLGDIQKVQRQFVEMHRQQLLRAAEQERVPGGAVSIGEHIARGSKSGSKR